MTFFRIQRFLEAKHKNNQVITAMVPSVTLWLTPPLTPPPSLPRLYSPPGGGLILGFSRPRPQASLDRSHYTGFLLTAAPPECERRVIGREEVLFTFVGLAP